MRAPGLLVGIFCLAKGQNSSSESVTKIFSKVFQYFLKIGNFWVDWCASTFIGAWPYLLPTLLTSAFFLPLRFHGSKKCYNSFAKKRTFSPLAKNGGDTVFDILVALVQLQYFLVRGTDTKKIHNFITALIVGNILKDIKANRVCWFNCHRIHIWKLTQSYKFQIMFHLGKID